ncbi:Hypothetical predicted protein [Cloeon dipterum]|uniref:Uncharacterized protein n=1 Tax=Cloeon dipterum TaxID=197152 RepID=A0A8S1BUY9_9INSE|nr:Hypothetical predicted protein [Cloeon dipterum]
MAESRFQPASLLLCKLFSGSLFCRLKKIATVQLVLASSFQVECYARFIPLHLARSDILRLLRVERMVALQKV